MIHNILHTRACLHIFTHNQYCDIATWAACMYYDDFLALNFCDKMVFIYVCVCIYDMYGLMYLNNQMLYVASFLYLYDVYSSDILLEHEITEPELL